ncbi:hypothetical protein TWF225_000229 [Orbilia oligospora]|nr:hypothetical protein TWF751_004262 [Orbilia oligospora]KAF3195859.1 hypothetical protein TWF225_000229 [Orbilia oligospora]KAF3266439.1 hypothetical protein TWF128_010842 [Orbilia oligospora]KAF3297605.1 hypothetical protein TWF132_006019 [Orbilia oligospora]
MVTNTPGAATDAAAILRAPASPKEGGMVRGNGDPYIPTEVVKKITVENSLDIKECRHAHHGLGIKRKWCCQLWQRDAAKLSLPSGRKMFSDYRVASLRGTPW